MRAVALATIVLALVGCSGGGSDDSPSAVTDDAGLIVCTEATQQFSTSLPSCDEAIEKGRQLVVQGDLGTAAGAELVFSSLCSAIQAEQPTEVSTAGYGELARALSESGVCPGDLSKLVPG